MPTNKEITDDLNTKTNFYLLGCVFRDLKGGQGNHGDFALGILEQRYKKTSACRFWIMVVCTFLAATIGGYIGTIVTKFNN